MRTSFLSRLSDDDQEQIESPSTDEPKNLIISRTHQFWPGTHRFFFRGRLISGPFRDTFIYYIFMVALVAHALLFLLVLLPQVSLDLHVYFLVLYAIFFVGSIVFYFLTAFTEPGLLPTAKFLKIRATLNREDQNQEKLNLLTRFLQGFYASVLNLYWQRKWDVNSRKTFSELNSRPIKLGQVGQLTQPIPEDVHAESQEDSPRSTFSNHRDNAEYHDDILTYKSESVRAESKSPEDAAPEPLPQDQNQEAPAVESKLGDEEEVDEQKPVSQRESQAVCTSKKCGGHSQCAPAEEGSDKNWLLEEYKSRFCLHCKIYKTRHAVHCDSCNSCVRVHNHHCVFVNNCIGKRNYKHFLALVTCLLLLNVYFIVAMFLAFPQLMLLDVTLFRSFIMLLFLQSVLVSGYCVFHLFLFVSFLIHGEDPSRVREHSPLRSFLFARLRQLKQKLNPRRSSQSEQSINF